MGPVPERNDVHGTLRHAGGVAGVAAHLGARGWSVRDASRTGREARTGWCEVVLAPDGDAVLLSGAGDPRRLDDLAALLAEADAAP